MRITIAFLAIIAVVAGCTGAAATPAPVVPAPPAGASPSSRADATTPVVVRVGNPTGDRWLVVADPTGRQIRAEADGLRLARDRVAVTSFAEDETRIEVREPMDGTVMASRLLPFAWVVPNLGPAAQPIGVSSDGSHLALIGKTPPETPTFAIVDTALSREPKVIQLTGRFTFDALSANGSILYVIEHLNGSETDYAVRAVDVATGKLRDGVIVDKRNLAATSMSGIATARVEAPGWSYTLYDGPITFIHALDTANAGALCIIFPADPAAPSGTAPHGWTLVALGSTRLLAVNPLTGQIVEADLSTFAVSRIRRFEPAEAPSTWVATSAASVAGDRVWVTSPTGVMAVDRRSLEVVGSIAVEGSVVSVVPLADGAVLVGRADGSVARLDPTF